MPLPPSVTAAFAAQVARTPDAVAVEELTGSGSRCTTYRELDTRSDRFAARLRASGVGPEDLVAVDSVHSAGLVVTLLAVLKAGAAYLPLHSGFPAERVQRIIDGAGCRVLVADAARSARGLPAGPAVVRLDEPAAGVPDLAPVAGIDGERLAYVLHTSGSTGEPKGVAVTHRGVVGLALDGVWDGGRHDRVLMLAPFAFGVSTYELWVPLLRGGTLVVPPPGPVDVASLSTALRDGRITGLHLTAGLFRVVAEEAPHVLGGVAEVLTGGDVIAPRAVSAVLAACPGIVVRALYGSTELSSFALSSPMSAPWEPRPVVPVGRPMDDVELLVLGPDGVPVPPGAVGELHVGGPRLARGYLHRPDLTAERFVHLPAAGGARYYRTGDLVRIGPDGLVEFAGRSGSHVKVRGHHVEPAELEAVLADAPGIAHAVVLARPSDADGHRLDAYVVAASGTGPVDVAALRERAAARLPDYLLPATVVELPALPLTPNGKLDRDALPEPAAPAAATTAPPVSGRLADLCRLFGEVLGTTVGPGDSFFDLDGQSLLAVRLVGRITTAVGVEVTMTDLFNAPTPAEIDELVGTRSAAPGRAA